MVNNRETALDHIFHALADKTRRDILKRLAQGDSSISRLAETYEMSLVAVSKDIRVLEKAGLVSTSKEGRIYRCSMQFEPLTAASEQISFYMQFWSQQMDGLDRYVQGVMSNKQKTHGESEHGQDSN
jgi:DNA-binding transcriptional ArsR family regulator